MPHLVKLLKIEAHLTQINVKSMHKTTNKEDHLTILALAYFQTVLTISVSGTGLITRVSSPASRTRARASDRITGCSIVTWTRVAT